MNDCRLGVRTAWWWLRRYWLGRLGNFSWAHDFQLCSFIPKFTLPFTSASLSGVAITCGKPSRTFTFYVFLTHTCLPHSVSYVLCWGVFLNVLQDLEPDLQNSLWSSISLFFNSIFIAISGFSLHQNLILEVSLYFHLRFLRRKSFLCL